MTREERRQEVGGVRPEVLLEVRPEFRLAAWAVVRGQQQEGHHLKISSWQATIASCRS